MADSTIIKTRCFCGANEYSASISTSSLPLRGYICQCNSCRHSTGALYNRVIDWPNPVPDSNTLTKYAFSKNNDTYFCSTCGAHMFWHAHHPTEWVSVVTGLLDNPDLIMDITSHHFVGDTIDGGFSDWLPSIEGRRLPKWEAGEETSKVLASGWVGSQGQDLTPNILRAHCKCDGLDFLIKRPREPEEADKPLDPKEWWVRSKNRYVAGNCACTSCRVTSGLEIVQWAYIPTTRLTKTNGEPYQFDCSTLRSFKSSEDVTRYHCGRCGATIFYWRDSRPEVIDVAVGILDAPSGARAEDWLDWRLKISYEGDATHGRLLKAFKEGLEDWGRRNGKTYN